MTFFDIIASFFVVIMFIYLCSEYYIRYILCITAEKIPSNKKTIRIDDEIAIICTRCGHFVYEFDTEQLAKYSDEDTGDCRGYISHCFECHKRR
jgi:hypothetical protein